MKRESSFWPDVLTHGGWRSAVVMLGLAGCATSPAPPDAAMSDAAGFDAIVADSMTADAITADAITADALAVDAPVMRLSDAFAHDANAPASLLEGTPEILFVGNSYIFVNNVSGRVRDMAEVIGPSPVRIESAVMGGYRLAQHATDAATDGTRLSRWLRTGTAEETSFDVVVLQEQSQIGGFPEDNAERMASLRGASALASLARDRAMDVVLYLTWGRERGDEANPALFGDFTAMQDRLDLGYRTMAARLRAEGSNVRVAPVGAAFRVVHDESARLGDPTREGTAFDALYDADGSHPSAQGAYLAATVILATISGRDPRTFADPSDLDAITAQRLREAAHAALSDPTWSAEVR